VIEPQQKTAPKQGDEFPWFAKVLMNCLIGSGAQNTHFLGRTPMKL
jgi:hypothetical protein